MILQLKTGMPMSNSHESPKKGVNRTIEWVFEHFASLRRSDWCSFHGELAIRPSLYHIWLLDFEFRLLDGIANRHMPV